jgi:hypothetical protein
MNSYSIQFIAKPQKGKGRTWELSQCSDIDKIQQRLRRIRQLVNTIKGSRSELLAELTDWKHIAQSCNPTWTRSITIPDPRAYTFFINLLTRTAYITTKEQGGQKIFPPIGVNSGNSDAYQNVIGFMRILIRLLEGMNSSNEDWVNDMSVGKVNPHQDWDDDIGIESLFNIFSNLQQPQAQSLIAAHPPEINIYTSPSSYKIIIIKHKP